MCGDGKAAGRSGPTWQTHAVFAGVANAGVVGLWFLTRDPTPIPGDEGPGYSWPLWIALVWGLLVVLHYLYDTGRLSQPSGPAATPPPGDGEPPADGAPADLPDLLRVLTRREREVLALVARGHPNKAIADRLFISERTTRTHVSNILRKLELPSRTQAALMAVQAGVTKGGGDGGPG